MFRRIALGVARRTIVVKDGWTKSIYGPWLADRWDDATFRFSVNASYGFSFSDLLAHESEPFVLLDIGANAGIYSLIAASNTRCRMVHSFEPDPNTFAYLRKNVRRSAPGRAIAHEVAVSDDARRVTLERKQGHSGRSRIISEGQTSSATAADDHQIEAVGHEFLNQLLAETPNARIIVKIDTEGHELPVLQAISRSDFVNQITAIWLEFDIALTPPAPVQDLLADLGLEIAIRRGSETHWDALYVRRVGECETLRQPRPSR